MGKQEHKLVQVGITPRPLFGLDLPALTLALATLGEPAFRARQLAQALYRQRVSHLDEITTFPKSLRERMSQAGWHIGRPAIDQVFTSSDGTERYLVDCAGETVEAVWMPEGDGGDEGAEPTEETVSKSESPESWRRATLCVSSQIGCAVNCQFCLNARLGLRRNLTPGEIDGQVVAALERHGVQVGRDRVNLVFMGMGEPFLNYENFLAAVRLLVTEVGLSPRRMTVSTSGILPGIERFALEPPEFRPRLAISLNAPNDEVREAIMPINRKYPLSELMAALRAYPLRKRRRITIEYTLVAGKNDDVAEARKVGRLLRGLPVKINVIPMNPIEASTLGPPDDGRVLAFQQELIAMGYTCFIRRRRGDDVSAACGQLALLGAKPKVKGFRTEG